MACLLKFGAVLGLVLLAAADVKPTPIDQVITLLQGVQKEIEKDGKNEQASYDKFACWVEDTLARKASDINSAKELISELNDSIKKAKAEIASHGAEIAQLNKDIAQNNEANKEATALRKKENSEYAEERTESEQCIGALEAGIKVLSGAGTKKSGFLQQFHEAQIMSVVGGVQKALAQMRSKLSDADAEKVMKFVENPQAFAPHGIIAAQTGQNPFGDYAPQSSQITGILQGMYDAMTADLEKDNVHEAESQKSFEELMATKKQELKTLTATLQKQETDSASKQKQLAEDQVQRDDTTSQLAADEEFFDETKASAQAKATEWSVRTRLRVEELAGIQGAVQILSGGADTFSEAVHGPGKSFVELKAVHMHTDAYSHLQSLAAKYQSSNLRRLMVVMKTGGHFDKVMVEIDNMMALLRKEEQDDIAHRDRCENGENANKNQMEDLNSDIKKTDKKLKRMDNTDKALAKELDAVKQQIKDSNKDLQDMLDQRNQDNADFKRALQMDSEAIGLITSATARLTKYYKDNKAAALVQKAPEYANDPDKAPETDFSGKSSHSSESGGIVAILDMIKEDLQKEMKEGRADEAKAQADYMKQSGALQSALDAQTETKVSLEKARADLSEKSADAEKFKSERQGDLDSQGDMKKSLATDCDWVSTNFKSRRDKRKTEMDGLVEAKSFLSGVQNGTPVLP
jgi:hypothetical protein